MPIHKVEVDVYECVRCHYKWTNWYDYRDGKGFRPGLIPKKCSGCKKAYWQNGLVDAISSKESALRTKIKFIVTELYPAEQAIGIFFPPDMLDSFFSVKPRPSIAELRHWLYPFGSDIRKEIKHAKNNDEVDRNNLRLKLESDSRIEFMTRIIRERLIADYDPSYQIQAMRETYLYNQEIIKQLSDVNNQSEHAIEFRKYQEEWLNELKSLYDALNNLRQTRKGVAKRSAIKKKIDSIKRKMEISIQQWPSDHNM